MFTGTLSLDLLLGDVRSLKQKRSVVRPIMADLRKLDLSVAEVGFVDLYRRALIGVAVVAATAKHCREVLETAERQVVARPEIELLSAHHMLYNDNDE